MTRIELKSRVGPDGMLEMKVPCGVDEADREVIVTIEPASEQKDRSDWHRFIAETAGSIEDPSFFRHEQGALDEPDGWQ